MANITYRVCDERDLPAFHNSMAINPVKHTADVQSYDDFLGETLIFGFVPSTDLFGAFLDDGQMVGFAEFRVFSQPPDGVELLQNVGAVETRQSQLRPGVEITNQG